MLIMTVLYLHLRTEYRDTLLITSFLIVPGINILKFELLCKNKTDRRMDYKKAFLKKRIS